MVRLLILFLLITFQTFIHSQTTYTLITSNGDWSNPAIWSPAGVPGPGDYVVLTEKNVYITNAQYTISGFFLDHATIFFDGTNPALTITDTSTWYCGEFDGGNGANGNGDINSIFTVGSNATITILTDPIPPTHYLHFYEGITVINQGIINFGGTINLGIRGLSVVRNEGLFNVVTDVDFAGESFSGGTFLNTASGIFRKSGGTDVSNFNIWWNFDNESGTIEVQSGTLKFDCNGTFTNGVYNAASGSVISFSSLAQTIKGTLTGSPAGDIRLAGSTISVDSSGATLDFQGTGFQWSRGTFTGGGTLSIPNGSLLRLVTDPVNPQNQALYGGTTLLNLGTIKQESNNSLSIRNNSVVDNRSLFDVTTDADFNGGTGSGGTFYNTGTFRKSGGNDVTQMNIWWKFHNQNGGVIDAASGMLDFAMPNPGFSNDSGATIKGAASIDVPSSFTNDGIIEPGSSIGVLSYIGNFESSATGVLDIQLGGLTAGTEYDQLNVTGNAALNGSLKVRVANGFVPNIGDTFVILNTSGTVSNNFSSLNIQDSLYLTVIVNSNNVTLIVDSVGVLDVEEFNDGEAVRDYSLSQNYPNPFNPTTKINFSLPQSGFVTLEVYSITGERVAELISQEMASGRYNYEWNASYLSSGVYIYRIKAGNFSDIKKMILLK